MRVTPLNLSGMTPEVILENVREFEPKKVLVVASNESGAVRVFASTMTIAEANYLATIAKLNIEDSIKGLSV